jgi:hypothetical protein
MPTAQAGLPPSPRLASLRGQTRRGHSKYKRRTCGTLTQHHNPIELFATNGVWTDDRLTVAGLHRLDLPGGDTKPLSPDEIGAKRR